MAGLTLGLKYRGDILREGDGPGRLGGRWKGKQPGETRTYSYASFHSDHHGLLLAMRRITIGDPAQIRSGSP
jgi:hypothetical protein